jgi:Rieske Fe-S protein
VPPGQVRRVARVEDDVDETKRNLLKLAAIAGILGVGIGGALGSALRYGQPPVVGLSSYPKVQLLDTDGSPLTVEKVVAEYDVNTSELLLFNYPLTNEPNFLLNLAPDATGVPGGIGPSNSIVAYSAICQHLGCPAPSLSYYPPSNPCSRTFGGLRFYLHCQCHGSTYDVTRSAAVLTGPTILPLPQVVLITDAPTGSPPEYPSGNIFAVGVSSPAVNGHTTTLEGGYGVGSSSPLVPENPNSPLACNFPT